eukprot:3386541-Alexandrium_andersonii.AAC.1
MQQLPLRGASAHGVRRLLLWLGVDVSAMAWLGMRRRRPPGPRLLPTLPRRTTVEQHEAEVDP